MKFTEVPNALSIYFNELVYKEKAAGKAIITLSLGEAFFDLPQFNIPPEQMEIGYHYSSSKGIPTLRKNIAEHYNKKYKSCLNYQKNLLISAGSKIIIFMCLKLLLKEKNEVLIFEPAWLSYEHQIKLANGIPKFIKYDITVNKIEEFVSKKTGVIIINNPNNPSGRVYSRADLEFLKNLCEKKEIFLLVDEAYSDFVVDKSFFSMARLSPKL